MMNDYESLLLFSRMRLTAMLAQEAQTNCLCADCARLHVHRECMVSRNAYNGAKHEKIMLNKRKFSYFLRSAVLLSGLENI